MIWYLLLILVTILLLLSAWICYRLLFYNRNIKEQDIYVVPPGKQYENFAEAMLRNVDLLGKRSYEQIYITANDGVRLAGRYYHIKENAPVMIMFHGYHGNGIREFALLSQIAESMGMNMLIVDQRAHGKSGGHIISFGIKERFDCVAWSHYAQKRFGEKVKIVLAGVSMGAATVLMASELCLPESVSAIIADCPYSAPSRIIRKVGRDMKLPYYVLYPVAVAGAIIFGGFSIWSTSPVRAVRNTRIPILLIHGEEDRLVPCDMSMEIYRSCANFKQILTVPQAGHGVSCYADTEKYKRKILLFLQACKVICI